ncbi:cytochrome c3 family protein [Geobacter sp. AOG2]|uniref:cytochrome c3 family protein n=1 Tax=Geobacter sp. AOG2 TaxID=1566347 RepID=UPI001CC6A5EB|nr:cytochrome c3 family protein [Geobacter sp. AOG2]GFE61857.1 cytochrome c [Geobacter sp. AOG2]
MIPLKFCLAFCLCLLAPVAAWSADSCRGCHEDGPAMKKLGYPGFTITQKEVEAQSGMPATCSDCHRGNPAARLPDEAHRGMGRLMRVGKGFAVMTSPRRYPLEFGASPAARLLVSADKGGKKVRDTAVTAILYHDKRGDTLSQNFTMMEQTCGSCHQREFAEFLRSTMAQNGKQSQYKGWLDEQRGPHNCGPWFEGNVKGMRAATAIPLSDRAAAQGQKSCSICHVGCLDCHYNPQPKSASDPTKGAHSFAKTPPPQSCYGNGRASVCHAGPEDRRRGAGYFGGSFSFPEGGTPDVHVAAKVGCLDCHESTKSNPAIGHAMVRRQAGDSCIRCHAAIVGRHKASLHRNLTCEACHIRNVGGYQGTYWGPGKLAGVATPYFKFKAYYGIMAEPFLLKDQQGRWIPVKPFPMAVMNQTTSPFRPGLHWRYPADLPGLKRTDDAWAYVGLFGGLPENNKALLWIQMDKMSHKYGKGRSCDSCHADPEGAQRQQVSWEYGDPGALPFNGSHEVVADKSGLFIRNIRSEKIELEPGYTLSALAPWVYLKDAWQVKGDFALPPIRDRGGYDATKGDLAGAAKAHIIH